MNIPDKIKIGGFEIKVELIENLMNERGRLGEYHPRTQTIKIDKATTKQQNEETLLHEILEAVTSIYDIDIEHKDLSNMATVLHQVTKDNPELFMAEKKQLVAPNINVEVSDNRDLGEIVEEFSKKVSKALRREG